MASGDGGRTGRAPDLRWLPAVLPVLAGATVVAVWWLSTVVFGIKPFILPAPPDIVRARSGTCPAT